MSLRRIALASAIAAAGLGSLVLGSASMAGAHSPGAARAPAVGRAPAAQAASGGARIFLRKTHLGMLLVNSHGFTLYAFSRDSRNVDRCVTISGCTGFWPLVRTGARPLAGPGVKGSLLGTIKVRGVLQVTYAGHPLYTYKNDPGPGATSYVGVFASKGVWRALRASGATVS